MCSPRSPLLSWACFYTFVPGASPLICAPSAFTCSSSHSPSTGWAIRAAYYVGRAIGKHKLAPSVSPGKSREGAIASVIGAIIFGLLYLGHFVPQIPLWQVALMAAIANVAGQFGDLAESAMKRGAGMKDSGTLLPGHGGFLDRLDSSLFALPVVYVLYRVLLPDRSLKEPDARPQNPPSFFA